MSLETNYYYGQVEPVKPMSESDAKRIYKKFIINNNNNNNNNKLTGSSTPAPTKTKKR